MSTINKLEELGQLRKDYEITLARMWRRRSKNCPNKKREGTGTSQVHLWCKKIKDLDNPHHAYFCSYNNCPYT